MKRVLLFSVLSLGVLGGCAWIQKKADGRKSDIEVAADSVAPFLPPPFGLIAGAVATLATGIASIGANKVSNEKYEKKEKPSALIRYATDHISPIMTTVAVAAPTLRAAGVIHMSDAELSLLMAAVGTPVVTKKFMRTSKKK